MRRRLLVEVIACLFLGAALGILIATKGFAQ